MKLRFECIKEPADVNAAYSIYFTLKSKLWSESTYLISHSNCSLSSEQPKSVVQACPIVNLWNFSMSMTPTWATAHPNSSGRSFTQAAETGHQGFRNIIYIHLLRLYCFSISCSLVEAYVPTSRPPLETPFIVSLEGEVYPSLIRYSAAHWKSVKQFCLFASMPAGRKNTKYVNEGFALVIFKRFPPGTFEKI